MLKSGDRLLHKITKCGYMCIDCRVAQQNPDTFVKFPCIHGKEDHGLLIQADYMCQLCPLMSNDYRAFEAEECPRSGAWSRPVKINLPKACKSCLPTDALKKPCTFKALPELAPEYPEAPATRSPCLPIPKREAPRADLQLTPPERLSDEEKNHLMAQLLEAQEQLEQLVLIQSLQDERKRLETLQKQQMQKNAPPGKALPSI